MERKNSYTRGLMRLKIRSANIVNCNNCTDKDLTHHICPNKEAMERKYRVDMKLFFVSLFFCCHAFSPFFSAIAFMRNEPNEAGVRDTEPAALN